MRPDLMQQFAKVLLGACLIYSGSKAFFKALLRLRRTYQRSAIRVAQPFLLLLHKYHLGLYSQS
jgi:hypothetical protein